MIWSALVLKEERMHSVFNLHFIVSQHFWNWGCGFARTLQCVKVINIYQPAEAAGDKTESNTNA